MKRQLKGKKLKKFWPVFVLLIAAFLRLWGIWRLDLFTYDQARDFLIVKRMLVDHKLTLVGPTVLIPGVYLPPFYYYSLAPFLLLFRFRLLGADVYTALLGVGAVLLFYWLTLDFFGRLPAFLSSLVLASLPFISIIILFCFRRLSSF